MIRRTHCWTPKTFSQPLALDAVELPHFCSVGRIEITNIAHNTKQSTQICAQNQLWSNWNWSNTTRRRRPLGSYIGVKSWVNLRCCDDDLIVYIYMWLNVCWVCDCIGNWNVKKNKCHAGAQFIASFGYIINLMARALCLRAMVGITL